MDPELKKKWVEALRSGRYKQGTEMLRSLDDEFCCLGVLCEVAGLKAGKTDDMYEYEGSAARAPLRFAVDQYELIELNDRMPFSEIADWIEANL